MTLGEKCKAKALEVLREELEEKMREQLDAYKETYDHFIKTGECNDLNCEDCPFQEGGIGSEHTAMACNNPDEDLAAELGKEIDD